jgi:hypothetical protein
MLGEGSAIFLESFYGDPSWVTLMNRLGIWPLPMLEERASGRGMNGS